MDLYSFVIPLGIATFVSLLITVLSGLKVIKLSFKRHRLSGLITLTLATLHGVLVLLSSLS